MKLFVKNLIIQSASLKVTVVVLGLMVISFAVSQLAGETLLSTRGTVFYSIFKFLHLTNMPNSWWFITLLCLFSINLLTCTLKRLAHTIKVLNTPKGTLDQEFINKRALKKEFVWKGLKSDHFEEVRKTISTLFTSPTFENGHNCKQFFAEKGRYSHWGFYLGHIGMLIMIIGGIFNCFGYQGFLELRKGESADTIIIGGMPNEIKSKNIGFSIRCDDYKILYYEGTDKIKDYQTSLTLTKEGEEIKRATINFSHFLKYQGVYIYQIPFGQMLKKKSEEITLHVNPKGTLLRSKKHQLKNEDITNIATTDHIKKNIGFNAYYPIQESNGNTFKVPAVGLATFDADRQLFQRGVDAGFSNYSSEQYNFYLLSSAKQNIACTRLNISKKPGKFLIWYGCPLVIMGFGINFYFSHRRIWVKIDKKDGIHHIVVRGTANKNMRSFENEFDNFSEKLKQHFF